MTKREEFIAVYQENIQRRGADRLLEWLDSDASDFFTAPSSTRFHGAYEGGLVEHSLNVYECLKDYLNRPRTKELYGMDYTPETIAVTALLHDICKVGFYAVDYRNAKNEQGVWEKVPYYTVRDTLPYGHGEKSVYMIQSFMRLTRDEAFAIRYHMGFSGNEDKNSTGNVPAGSGSQRGGYGSNVLSGRVCEVIGQHRTKLCTQMACKAVRRALCGVAIGA